MIETNRASACGDMGSGARGRRMRQLSAQAVRGGALLMKTATRVAATTLGMALAAAGARADEPGRTRPTSANPLPPTWTGAYVGGHLGCAWGNSDWTAYGPAATATSGSFDYALG